MKITKRELRRLLGEAKLEKGYESWDDWQNPGNYAPTQKPVSKAAAEEKVAYSPSGRVEHPSREEMWGFEEEYEEDVDPAAMFDYETGEDDVPYGAADYALMQGRGRRTDEGRRLREAKGDKKRGSEAATKARPDGYHDLPAFMSIAKQSPAKYSSFHADDPAVVDPLGQDIDADALRIVRQLQARGAGKREDKKKLKEATVNVTRRDIRRLVNEALSEMSMMGGPRGMRRPRRSMCLYVIYSSGMSVSYYVADPPPPDTTPEEFDAIENAAINTGTDVTADLDLEGMGMPDAFTLYSWLQDHDEITHVYDIESSGGLVSKAEYMEQVRAVGEEEGLFAPEDVVNEGMGRGDDVHCLYILKRGGQHVYIVARPYIESAEELAETGNDITDMIMAQGPAARNSNVYEFLSSNPHVAVVRVRGAYEMADDYMMELEDSMDFSTGPVNESDDKPLDEMEDSEYNDDLQSRHGRFTSPENVKGTPQHRALHGPYTSDRRGAPSTPMGPASGEELERIRARLAAEPPQPLVAHWGPNSPDQPYYDVRHNIREAAFPEEIEGIYGEEPPEFDEMGPGDDSFLDYDPEEIPDMGDMYDPDYYEGLDDEDDDYSYGDDPDEFLDLPAGEIQQRLDRGPVPRRGLREADASAAIKAEKGEAVNEARWAKLAGILKG